MQLDILARLTPHVKTRGGHGLDFSKSNLDLIQIQINGLDLKSISTLARSNIFGFFLNPFKVD